jgi:hypothetical protein
MSDLVNRLRQRPTFLMYLECADLIEQLQAQNAMMQASRSSTVESLKLTEKRQAECIRALTEQCAALVWERDSLKNSATMNYAVLAGDGIVMREQAEQIKVLREALEKYDKLTSHDGWYADLVKETLEKTK